MTKEELKQYIDENVYENQDGDITGEGLNAVLKAIVDDAGTKVEANPEGEYPSAVELDSLRIDEQVYAVPTPRTPDAQLSDTSTNAVQNKVVKAALDEKAPASNIQKTALAGDVQISLGKADTALQSTGVKTINNQSIVGSGNISIEGGGTEVEANPTGEATETLGKIKIGDTIYTAPQGPQGEPGEDGQDGQPGAPGPANTLSIGTVTGGDTASAEITGTSPNQVLNLTLPRGQQGVPGQDGADAVNPFKGWWPDLATLKAAHTAIAGDSAYVKDASPATTWSIYVYDSTASSDNYWADSGLDADTSNVQTFASGEEVNLTPIDNTHLVNPVANSLAKAEDVKELKEELYGYIDTQEESIALPSVFGGSYQNASSADGDCWFGAGNARCGVIDLSPYKEAGYKKLKITMAAFESNVHGAGRFTFVKNLTQPTTTATGKTYSELSGYLSGVHNSYSNVCFSVSSGTTTIVDIPEDAVGVNFVYRLATDGGTPTTTYRKPASVMAFGKKVNGDIDEIELEIEELRQQGLPDESVTTDKIADGAVTSEKIADGAVEDALTGAVNEYSSFNLLDYSAVTKGNYIMADGTINGEGTGSNRITDFIKLNGRKIYWGVGFIGSYGVTTNVGAAVYDGNQNIIKVFSASVGSTGSSSYDPVEADEGAEYIRLAYTQTYSLIYVVYAKSDGSNPMLDQAGLTTGMIDDYYETQVVKQSRLTTIFQKGSVPELIPAYSSVGQNGFSKTFDTINGGNYGYITSDEYPSYLKCNHTISFKGYLADTLSGTDYIRFGLKRNDTVGKVLDITPTEAIIKRYDSGSGYVTNKAFTHNLTIKDFIMCEITFTWYGGKFRIISSDGAFVQEWQNSQYSYTGNAQVNYGRAFVEPSVALTNVKLTQSSDRFMKPVWVIGDSYTSMSQARWTYQLVNNFGIDGFLLDGYAGAPSENMVPELEKLLRFGTPKYLLWCLGMNDGAVIWKYCSTKVEQLCRERGITLIYQTIPWPSSESSAKQKINGYVKESGYRYVDGYAAVCSDANGTWYDGMNDDGTHPTVLGAKALAGQVLIDFPEIANYK